MAMSKTLEAAAAAFDLNQKGTATLTEFAKILNVDLKEAKARHSAMVQKEKRDYFKDHYGTSDKDKLPDGAWDSFELPNYLVVVGTAGGKRGRKSVTIKDQLASIGRIVVE